MTDSSSSLRLAISDLKDTMVYKFELLKDELQEVKNQMADLNQSVADLQAAVTAVAERVGQLTGPLQEEIANLQTTLQAERDAAATLAASEDAEDVQQNQDLTDARAATDAALANAQQAADGISAEVQKLNQVASAPTE